MSYYGRTGPNQGFRILTEKVRKSSTSGRLRFEGAIAAYRAKGGRARIQAERSDSEHSADGVAERCRSASVRRRGRSAGPGPFGPHPPTRLGEVLPQSVGQGQAGERAPGGGFEIPRVKEVGQHEGQGERQQERVHGDD